MWLAGFVADVYMFASLSTPRLIALIRFVISRKMHIGAIPHLALHLRVV